MNKSKILASFVEYRIILRGNLQLSNAIMKKCLLLFNLLFWIFAPMIAGHAGQEPSEFFSKADAFFENNIKDGKVAYADIKEDPAMLDELIQMAQGISVSQENVKEYQAFWINGYNLLVIKGIVDNYPLKSPIDIDGFFDRKKWEIGGKQITLNAIENKLLRKNFPNEPRFHFVLVCGALGCPPIIDAAYMPSTLDAQLDEQTKKALNDPNFIRVDKHSVKVSQIFEWYKEDFTRRGQTLTEFISQYRDEKLPEDAKVSYYEYDWTLNGMK